MFHLFEDVMFDSLIAPNFAEILLFHAISHLVSNFQLNLQVVSITSSHFDCCYVDMEFCFTLFV